MHLPGLRVRATDVGQRQGEAKPRSKLTSRAIRKTGAAHAAEYERSQWRSCNCALDAAEDLREQLEPACALKVTCSLVSKAEAFKLSIH